MNYLLLQTTHQTLKNMCKIFCILILFLAFNSNMWGQNSLRKGEEHISIKKEIAVEDTSLPPEIEEFINEEVEFDIPIITCEELRRLKKEAPKRLVILDARSQKAYNVSHLEKARFVGYNDFSIEHIWSLHKDQIIVIYSKAGIQSEQIGERMRHMGFKDVRNLYGGLGEWYKQQGRLVDRAGKKTTRIYDSKNKKK